MHSISFWKSWPKLYQRFFWVFTLIMFAAVLWSLLSFARNPSPVFTWQQVQELQQPELTLHTFELAGIELGLTGSNNIIFERWLGNPIQTNAAAIHIYILFFLMSMVIMLSIITILPRFWFFVGTGAAVFLLSSLQWESLLIFSLSNKIPATIVITLFIGICLYFQFFNNAASFLARCTAFAAAMLAIGIFTQKFSNIPYPIQYLATSTIPATIVLMVIFIVMVSHEIIASFVTLADKGSGTKTFRDFLIISSVYLLNLWLTYWHNIRWIEWGFSIPSFLLLIVSGVLAVWGIRQRQPQYENILPDGPLPVYFIMAFGSLALAGAGFFFATANDLVILALNNLILYAHIGYGMMFLAYVGSNFLGLFDKDLPVHKVLYKPTNMPYFSFRLAGLIFTLAFIFYNSWMAPVNQFISGYFTAMGDHYTATENPTLALGYYRRAYIYSSYNQHAATALAKIEAERGNELKSTHYLSDANKYHPTEFTLLNSANALHVSGKILEEILVLREARKLIPGSPVIKNNLGLAYARLGVLDSAFLFFAEARKGIASASAEMNLLGLIAQQNLKVNADSVYRGLNSRSLKVKSNAMAIANRLGKTLDVRLELPTDSVLNLFSATLIGNYITNHIADIDSTLLLRCIDLARRGENRNFGEIVLVPAANALYLSGGVNHAYQILQELIFTGGDRGNHNLTMATWSLQQGKPDVALSYLDFALKRDSKQYLLTRALALTEGGKADEAIMAWDSVARSDSSTRWKAESMKRVMAAPESWFNDFTDEEKCQYLRYRFDLPSTTFDRLIPQIRSEDIRAKAILDRAKKWLNDDEVEEATRTYGRLQGLHLADARIFSEIKYFELRLLARQRQWALLKEQMDKGLVFGPYREPERVYYQSLLLLNAGDSVAAARGFDWMAQNDPYFDEGIVAAANFFDTYGDDRRRSYHILSEALQVNPHAVAILKAYVVVALRNGYDEYASSSLQTLKTLLTPDSFRRFVSEKQLTDLLLQ